MCFSVFQEAILGQNYCGEDSHSSLSISISSNFSSLIHLSVFSILSIFSSQNTLSFKLNASQDKYIAHSTGNFGFVFEKNKSGDSCSDSEICLVKVKR